MPLKSILLLCSVPIITVLLRRDLFGAEEVAVDAGKELAGHQTEEPIFRMASPELDVYSDLWRRSPFTSNTVLSPPPAAEEAPPTWASDFQFSGWVRLNGRLTVYLTRSKNPEPIALEEGQPAVPDVPQLLGLSGEETIWNARAHVALNGQSAWISVQSEASPHTNPPIKNQPTPETPDAGSPAPVLVTEPTVVDSRAAKLSGPVLLDSTATFQSITSTEGAPTTDNYERLQNRRDRLIRAFPRQPEP